MGGGSSYRRGSEVSDSKPAGSVNGNVELRRSTRVQPGDVVEIAGQGKFVVGREA